MIKSRKRQSSSPSDSDDEVECPLTGAEALNACKQFASATNTDTGLAMMMLQKNNWELEKAIDAYQNSSVKTSNAKRTKNSKPTDSSQVEAKKNYFKLLSWNIDGLDEQANTIEVRTRGVIDVIQKEEPDVIFLQEVIPFTLDLIQQLLPDYQVHSGNNQSYFVAILTRRQHFKVQQHEIIAYPGSKMNRNLLIVHTLYKEQMEIDLMTSHHESGKEEWANRERIDQLKFCFQQMVDAPTKRFVLFGGDLNLRENELRKAGGIPTNIVDLWIATGQRKECAYTWDMNRNTNHFYPSDSFRPRARFDRLFYRSASESTTNSLQPIYFELEGMSKLPSIKRYCSDHWAIQAYFHVL